MAQHKFLLNTVLNPFLLFHGTLRTILFYSFRDDPLGSKCAIMRIKELLNILNQRDGRR